MRKTGSVPREVHGVLRTARKSLITADLAYKVLAFVLLTPLSALLLQLLVRFSGQGALSDQDILFFFLRPVGWVTLIAAGAIVVGLVAMEVAALMMIGLILLVAAPFLAVVGAAYLLLLTQHDINYYLTLKPVEYWIAVGIAVVMVGALLLSAILDHLQGLDIGSWFGPEFAD